MKSLSLLILGVWKRHLFRRSLPASSIIGTAFSRGCKYNVCSPNGYREHKVKDCSRQHCSLILIYWLQCLRNTLKYMIWEKKKPDCTPSWSISYYSLPWKQCNIISSKTHSFFICSSAKAKHLLMRTKQHNSPTQLWLRSRHILSSTAHPAYKKNEHRYNWFHPNRFMEGFRGVWRPCLLASLQVLVICISFVRCCLGYAFSSAVSFFFVAWVSLNIKLLANIDRHPVNSFQWVTNASPFICGRFCPFRRLW